MIDGVRVRVRRRKCLGAGETAEALLSESLEEKFDRDGFVIVEQAVSRDRIGELRQRIARHLGRPPEVTEQAVIMDCYVACPDTIDSLLNEKGVAALKALLGDDFVVLPDSSITIDRWNVLHTDTSSWEMANMFIHQEDGFRMVTVGMYLQDAEQGGGGLYVVPESHKAHDVTVDLRKKSHGLSARVREKLGGPSLSDRLEGLKEDRDGLNIQSRAGDMVIFDMRMLHRSQKPDAATQPPPPGGRIAFFSRCVRNIPSHIDQYVAYMKDKPDGEHLLDPARKPSDNMQAAAQQFGVQVM